MQETKQAESNESDGSSVDFGEFVSFVADESHTLCSPEKNECDSSLQQNNRTHNELSENVSPLLTSVYCSPRNDPSSVPNCDSSPTPVSPMATSGDNESESTSGVSFRKIADASFMSFDSDAAITNNNPPYSSLTPYEYAAAASDVDDGDKSRCVTKDTHSNNSVLVGFDTLDPVQCYAVGALAVVLLRQYTSDLNGLSFARAHVANILKALCLSEGQQAALFALSPRKEDMDDVVQQCVELVGDDATRFRAVQAMLALAVVRGVYDARSRAFLCSVANAFGVPWSQVAAVELAVAMQLFSQADIDVSNEFGETTTTGDTSSPKTPGEILAERRRKKQKVKRVMKVGGITLVGGILFGVTGGIIAPALLSALAGVGVTSAAGLAASGSVASGAVVGSLFGVAGAGVTQGKARKRTISRLEEFDFERPDDPRVLEEKERRTEREAQRIMKHQQQLLLKHHGEDPELPINVSDQLSRNSADSESDITCKDRSYSTASDVVHSSKLDGKSVRNFASETENVDEQISPSDRKNSKKNRKKQKKLIVGSQGLEAAGQIPSLHICICVPAWLNERRYGSSLRQFEEALKAELPCSQHIALRWESRRLFEMGLAFAKFWASKATVTTIQNAYPHAVAAASSVAGAIAFAFALPLTVLSCLDYIDNPWSVLVSLSNTAGEDLADVLVARSYGQRPVTLFGYSIGARVIFKCLESLASRGALGIVDNVFFMSAPVSADPKRWTKIRPVVAGRIVNGYGTMDWALAFFHRGCGHGVYVSGLRAVELDGVENLNMSYIGLEGHKELKDVIPRAMNVMGVGRGYISIPPAKVVTRSSQLSNDTQITDHESRRGDMKELMVSGGIELPFPEIRSVQSSGTGQSELGDRGSSSYHQDQDLISEDALTGRSTEKREVVESKEKKKGLSWYKITSWNSKRSVTSSNHNLMRKLTNDEVDSVTRPSRALSNPIVNGSNSKTEPPNHVNSSRYVNGILGLGGADEYSDFQRRPSPSLSEDERVDPRLRDDEWDSSLNPSHANSHSQQDDVTFDWDLQRRIWEQQERQLRERGFADDAHDIETGSKIVLGIGIEVAGLRIHPFISQDSELPVAPVVEYFTNCCIDQKGITVRVFEHEKKRRSLPLNPFRQEKKYPKHLGELELTWSDRRPRAEARFAVSVEANSDGEIIVRVSERHRDGSRGHERKLRVPRSALCTMREREEMEKDKQVLLLTAP